MLTHVSSGLSFPLATTPDFRGGDMTLRPHAKLQR